MLFRSYVILLASAFAVLGETYGDMLRAAGATERLMELLHAQSEVTEPMQPVTPAWPKGGAELTLEEVRFHYPSRSGTWARLEPGLISQPRPSSAPRWPSRCWGIRSRRHCCWPEA